MISVSVGDTRDSMPTAAPHPTQVAQHEATINELEQQHKVLLHSAKTSATKTETGSRSERSKHDKQAAEITSLAEKARDAERRAKAQVLGLSFRCADWISHQGKSLGALYFLGVMHGNPFCSYDSYSHV